MCVVLCLFFSFGPCPCLHVCLCAFFFSDFNGDGSVYSDFALSILFVFKPTIPFIVLGPGSTLSLLDVRIHPNDARSLRLDCAEDDRDGHHAAPHPVQECHGACALTQAYTQRKEGMTTKRRSRSK